LLSLKFNVDYSEFVTEQLIFLDNKTHVNDTIKFRKQKTEKARIKFGFIEDNENIFTKLSLLSAYHTRLVR